MKPKQYFMILIGFFGALVLAGGGGYYLALKELNSQSGKLSVGLASQADADAKIENLSRLKRQYTKDIEPILPMLDKALPRDKKQTEILAQLQSIAAQSGLQITSVNLPSPIGLPTSVSQTIKSGAVLALPISF